MKPGFLLEAARRNVRSAVSAGCAICVIALIVLGLNGKYVYNWIAGPFPVSSTLAEIPDVKEFAHVSGSFISTGIAEQSTTTVRVFRRALEVGTKDVTAIYYLVALDGRFLVVKGSPNFAGNSAEGRLVALPEKLRSLPQLSEVKVADGRTLRAEELYPMMLDAGFSYRADANLFVIGAAFFLVVGGLGTLVSLLKARSPQNYPMLRLVARSGPVLSTLRRIEQEFITAGKDASAGPLLVSSSWIYSPGPGPLVFPLKDVIAVARKSSSRAGKPPSFSVEFWLRTEPRSYSVKAGEKECDVILNALSTRIPWAIVESDSGFASNWSRDRKACIAEMEKKKKLQEATALAAR